MGRKEKEERCMGRPTVNDFGNPSYLVLTDFFSTTRRVERLLIKQPPVSSDSSAAVTAPLAPLPTGLLILSMTRLRSYALNYLPSSIREPFLEDLGDLEDPELDTNGKLRIVERMWRSWGTIGEGVIRP